MDDNPESDKLHIKPAATLVCVATIAFCCIWFSGIARDALLYELIALGAAYGYAFAIALRAHVIVFVISTIFGATIVPAVVFGSCFAWYWATVRC